MTRIDESRKLIQKALDHSYGSYVEQEGKKSDQWRDQDVFQLLEHLKHEVKEVDGNVKRREWGFMLHNAMDVIELGAMLYNKAQEMLD